MSYDRKQFIVAVQNLLSSEDDKQYEKFLSVVENYRTINQFELKSIHEFDRIHNDLLNLLVPNDHDPLIDSTQYERFELIMKSLRRIVENLVMNNCVSTAKIDELELNVNNLQMLVYEREFQRLLYSISNPVKCKLVSEFRRNNIRIDPLDEELLDSLYKSTSLMGISREKMEMIKSIFIQLARQIGLSDRELVQTMLLRLKRNADEQEVVTPYIKQCNRSKQEAEFLGLINHLHLNGLLNYKPTEVQILKKIFDFYVTDYQ